MSDRQRTIDRQLQQQRDRERHIIRKQRSRHAAQVRAQDGCLMTVTATIATTFVVLAALVAVTRKVTPR